MSFLTTGKAINKVGNANSQEMPQAPSQTCIKLGDQPRLRKVLMADTTQVIKIDNKNGITSDA